MYISLFSSTSTKLLIMCRGSPGIQPSAELVHPFATNVKNHYVNIDIRPHMWSGRFATLQLKCVAKRSLAILENVPECFGHTYYWSRDHCIPSQVLFATL